MKCKSCEGEGYEYIKVILGKLIYVTCISCGGTGEVCLKPRDN